MINTLSESLYRLDLLNTEQDRITYQSSTKKKIDNGSDDSLVFTRQIYLENKVNVFEGLKEQIEITTAQNDTADTAVGSIKDKMTLAKTEILRALNDTEQATSRGSIAINVEGIKKSLLLFANEKANGEYLFSGTNGTQAPFEQDPVTGDVTYTGNGYLKKVAVEEGSYRERGVTGFDLMMNTTDKAVYGSKLTFTADQRVVDEQGNEWTLNAAVPELVKNNENGVTSETMPLTEILPATTPKTYETTNAISTPGQTLSAKENIFDIFDDVIDALNQVDSNGAPISKTQADAILKDGLAKINTSFDTVNEAHSDLGVRNKIFEVSYEKLSSKLTHFNVLYEDTSGADLAKVAMESKALELTYTSLYSTINKMNELSLVNFIN